MPQAKIDKEMLAQLEAAIVERGREISEFLSLKFSANDDITLTALIVTAIRAAAFAGASKASTMQVVKDSWRRGVIDKQQWELAQLAAKPEEAQVEAPSETGDSEK